MRTMAEPLHHFHLFLVVEATEQLTLLDHVQVALLQANSAHHAHKTAQMENVVAGSHYELFGGDSF